MNATGPAGPAVVEQVAAATVPSAELTRLIGLLSHSSADIARDAATELGSLGSAEAIGSLIEMLQNRNGYSHVVARFAPASSLGKLKDRRAVNSLIFALRDGFADVTSESASALGNLRDDRAIAALLEVVRNESGYFLNTARHAAIMALGRLRTAQTIGQLRMIAEDVNESPAIRDAAATSLVR